MTIQTKMVIITLAMVLLLSPLQAAAALFQDVTEKSNVYPELNFLVKQGILIADENTSYGVKNQATRYDVAYLLVQSLHLKVDATTTDTVKFSDVPLEDPRLPYIHAIANAKLMGGYADGTFLPDKPVTRAQLSKLLVTAFQLKGSSKETFSDVPSSHPAYSAISTMIANQITSGFENNVFNPNSPITKGQLAVFIARILEPSFRVTVNQPIPKPEPPPTPAPAPVEKTCVKQTTSPTYRVDVAVTNLWHSYNANRTVDAPSMVNPVKYDKWIGSMNLSQKKWLVGRTDTQALYGDEVSVLNTRGNMYYVAAKDQYVPYNKSGYPGWVPKGHIVKTNVNVSSCSIAIVKAQKATLYNEINKKAFLTVSYATILPVIKQQNGYYYVQTPANGVKLLKTSAAKSYKSYKAVPKPSQADIVNTAKRFLGLKYLWAGTSSWGYDCSGIIYAAYRAHGIMIPRDSFYQATKGKKISKAQLQPGDLVFFGYNGGKGKVYHVGLYIGNGYMLHSPNYASQVRIERLNTGVYLRNYAGARRYL